MLHVGGNLQKNQFGFFLNPRTKQPISFWKKLLHDSGCVVHNHAEIMGKPELKKYRDWSKKELKG